MDILVATAQKFYPAATNIKTTLTPDPKISLTVGKIACEVSVPAATSLEHFEEEAWFGFRNLRESVTGNDVDVRPVNSIKVRSDAKKARAVIDPESEKGRILR